MSTDVPERRPAGPPDSNAEAKATPAAPRGPERPPEQPARPQPRPGEPPLTADAPSERPAAAPRPGGGAPKAAGDESVRPRPRAVDGPAQPRAGAAVTSLPAPGRREKGPANRPPAPPAQGPGAVKGKAPTEPPPRVVNGPAQPRASAAVATLAPSERGGDVKARPPGEPPRHPPAPPVREPDGPEHRRLAVAEPRTAAPAPVTKPKSRLPGRIAFVLLVIVPTLLVALYYAFFAANIYQTEARFLIRGQEAKGGLLSMSSLGSLLSETGMGATRDESLSIIDYFQSLNAVEALDKTLDLRAIFGRPKEDFWARLPGDASEEELRDYYRSMIDLGYDSASGLVTLRVRAFDRQDTVTLTDALLDMGERLVNQFNVRAQEDMLALARSEVKRAEDRLLRNREALTRFRHESEEIDPSEKSGAILSVITSLDAEIAKTEAEIAELSSFMRPNNLRIASLRTKLEGLRGQVKKEQKRLTGKDNSLADMISSYESLQLERELANRAYESAVASMETARTDALRQHNYLVRVVTPTLPDEASYPWGWRNTAMVFVGLLLAFALGRLVIAGVRDHLLT